jgi:hypothetical protein
MPTKGPSTSHNSLKIIARETLLKMLSTLTYITAQSGCRMKRVRMPKGMASKPPRVNAPN